MVLLYRSSCHAHARDVGLCMAWLRAARSTHASGGARAGATHNSHTSSLSERKIRQGSERLIGQEWAARSESGCTFGSAGDVPSLVFRASSQLTRRSVGAQHMQSFEIEGQTDQTPLSGGGLPAA